jgi:hypothetical protein
VSASRDGEPGAVLLHPLTLAFLTLWIVNDHVLKQAYPGLLSGKLSDVASLVVFPLLMLASVELVWPSLSKTARRIVLGLAVAATGSVMISIKLFEPAAWVYREGLGALQWPFYAAHAWLRGVDLPGLRSVHLAMDASDILTLPSLSIAVWIAESTQNDASHIRARSPSSVV